MTHEGPRPDTPVTTRHGVPHVVVPAPGPVRARLLFRVGIADEPLYRRGITHLVEHLTMRAVFRRPVQVEAHVGAWSTAFEATGALEAVTAFLEDVWRTLSDLPLDALDVEREVLRLEGRDRGASPAVESAHHRYGLTGPGLVYADELGLPGLTAEDVRAWVAERFVRGAAVVAATADVRPDLSGGLPDGPARDLTVTVLARPARGPVWVGDTGGTAVSLLLPVRDGLDLAVGRLLRTAAEQVVRHEKGLAYEVGMDVVEVGPDLTEVAVHADCDEERHAEVADLLVGVLRRFRDHGPSEADVALERDTTVAVWQDAPDALEVATESAVALLLGQEPRSLAVRVHDAQQLTASAVRDVVSRAWPSLQVLLPVEEEPGVEGVHECVHTDEALPGRVHCGNPLAFALPGARLPASPSVTVTAGERGLTLRMDDEVVSIAWEEVAAVVDEGDGLLVISSRGEAISLPDGTFWRSGRLRRTVEDRVDRSRFVPRRA
ncbi:hypothetical protein [Jannaschia sp. R86511]|uniref:hypothetical protein n=1 Tax=Jannaschia sp. R86511 TaxID=3093853 RepID=UPI0036D30353